MTVINDSIKVLEGFNGLGTLDRNFSLKHVGKTKKQRVSGALTQVLGTKKMHIINLFFLQNLSRLGTENLFQTSSRPFRPS
jgi:hypothetical protein